MLLLLVSKSLGYLPIFHLNTTEMTLPLQLLVTFPFHSCKTEVFFTKSCFRLKSLLNLLKTAKLFKKDLDIP